MVRSGILRFTSRIAHLDYTNSTQVQSMNQIWIRNFLAPVDFPTSPVNSETTNELFSILTGHELLGTIMINPEEWNISMQDKEFEGTVMNNHLAGQEIISPIELNKWLKPTVP